MSHSAGPACTQEPGCITCGDHAVPLSVVDVDESRGLARCVDESGALEDVEIALVGAVSPGDSLLVHAGTALQTLQETPA